MPDEFITVHHPELSLESQVAERALQHMPGWREGPLPDKDYDPGEHTVAVVQAYLDQAEPTARAKVLDREREGKARAGILAYSPPSQTEPAAEQAGDSENKELRHGPPSR